MIFNDYNYADLAFRRVGAGSCTKCGLYGRDVNYVFELVGRKECYWCAGISVDKAHEVEVAVGKKLVDAYPELALKLGKT